MENITRWFVNFHFEASSFAFCVQRHLGFLKSDVNIAEVGVECVCTKWGWSGSDTDHHLKAQHIVPSFIQHVSDRASFKSLDVFRTKIFDPKAWAHRTWSLCSCLRIKSRLEFFPQHHKSDSNTNYTPQTIGYFPPTWQSAISQRFTERLERSCYYCWYLVVMSHKANKTTSVYRSSLVLWGSSGCYCQ